MINKYVEAKKVIDAKIAELRIELRAAGLLPKVTDKYDKSPDGNIVIDLNIEVMDE